MDETGQKLIEGRHCPKCGYNLTGRAVAAEVRCPECGRVSEYEKLSIGPPPGPIGRILRLGQAVTATPGRRVIVAVTIALCLFLIAAVGFQPRSKAREGVPLHPRQALLRNLSRSLATYTSEHDDCPPQHAGELLLDDYATVDQFFAEDIPIALQRRRFRNVALDKYDGTDDAKAELRLAIEWSDPNASFYRFGDIWFVRWPPDFSMTQLGIEMCDQYVEAWTTPDEKGLRVVLFTDGHIEGFRREDWSAVWAADAAARQQCDLTPINPPESAE